MHLTSVSKATLAQLGQMLRQKKLSSVELTQFYLDRIRQLNPTLNAFITVCEETALSQAALADAQLKRPDSHPLAGIPLAQKDIFCTEGILTTCASRMLHNFIAPYSSTVATRLSQAGMVLLGKTNMDEFAMGSSNENSFYGPVKNPWNLDCVPGGSSGGSAAAVAACLTPVATGTDTGGSIRQPAALSGITGLKPTYGRVSRWGMIAFASSLDQGGPMAPSAEDCALLLEAMAGYDSKDATSVNRPVPPYSQLLDDSVRGMRIGLPKPFFGEQLDPALRQVLHEAMQLLEKMGAKMVEVDLPHVHLSVPTYYILASAECSSNLARYDGVRYGYRCDQPTHLDDLYKRSRSEGFGREVQRRILIGTYVLSAGFYDAYYLKAQQIRRLIQNDFESALREVDVLLAPTAPQVAFELGSKTTDPVHMYLSDIFTIGINLAGLPALSMPVGFHTGLPVGLQVIGPAFEEGRILRVAHQYQQQTDWHLRVPTVGA